jgi:hypothetical protein
MSNYPTPARYIESGPAPATLRSVKASGSNASAVLSSEDGLGGAYFAASARNMQQERQQMKAAAANRPLRTDAATAQTNNTVYMYAVVGVLVLLGAYVYSRRQRQ